MDAQVVLHVTRHVIDLYVPGIQNYSVHYRRRKDKTQNKLLTPPYVKAVLSFVVFGEKV